MYVCLSAGLFEDKRILSSRNLIQEQDSVFPFEESNPKPIPDITPTLIMHIEVMYIP